MQNRKRETDVQNRLLDSVGEGEGGMFRENSIKTSILSRVKQIPSPGAILKGVNVLGKQKEIVHDLLELLLLLDQKGRKEKGETRTWKQRIL